MWSWGSVGREDHRIPARPAAGLAGERWGCDLLSPRARFWGLDRQGQRPASGSAAPSHGGRWELGSGEGVVRPGQQAGVEARLDPREDAWVAGRLGKLVGTGAQCWRQPWYRQRRSGGHAWGGFLPFIGGRVKAVHESSLRHGHGMGEIRGQRACGSQPMADGGRRRSVWRGLWARVAWHRPVGPQASCKLFRLTFFN
jgi:hypothetical protein